MHKMQNDIGKRIWNKPYWNSSTWNSIAITDYKYMYILILGKLCLFQKLHKPEPELFTLLSMTANSIILICCPYYKDNIKTCCCVIEKLGHNSFHSCRDKNTFCLLEATLQEQKLLPVRKSFDMKIYAIIQVGS